MEIFNILFLLLVLSTFTRQTNNDDCPTIGDNVTVYCGAKVLGDVHVGNNVIVAANAVVVKDVKDNCVVGGVPAKVIKNL